MKLIYCVENNESSIDLITYALCTADFEVVCFKEISDLYKALTTKIPDLILLDIMLSKFDGLSILYGLKNDQLLKKIPVIIINGNSSETDIVKFLESGADDYITKPFGVLEFMARIKAVLRRSGSIAQNSDTIESNGILLDYKRREASYNSKEIVLNYKEFELLYYLITNKGLALSRKIILKKVWGNDYKGETRTVDIHIRSIRLKLGSSGCPNLIKTVTGVGYKFDHRQAVVNAR